MAFLNNINELRSVEWSASYLWDIRFSSPTPPQPFNRFFPAMDVEENLTTLDSQQFDLNHRTVKIPHKSNNRTLTITFSDDIENTLLTWFHDWIDGDIFNETGGSVAVLEEAVRRVDILKMDAQRNTLSTSSYWVYPEGPLTFSGTSEAKMHQYNLQFVVCGRIGTRPRSPKGDFTTQQIPTSPNTVSRLTDDELDKYAPNKQDSPSGTTGRS